MKKLFFLLIFYFINFSVLAQSNPNNWSKNCVKGPDNKESCAISVTNQIEDKDKKKVTLATAFVLKGEESVKSKDKEAKEVIIKKSAIILVINLPLNVDLGFKPQVQLDGKKAFDINYTNCNQKDGCKTTAIISSENFEKIKKAKILSAVTRAYGTTNNIKIDFSLKDFESEFKKL
jgi:invasion protein IalB